nr:MAG TPA: hypothetical protein [Caudoviricetes sp.]
MLFFGICEPIDTVSFVWVLLSPTRTILLRAVRDRPVGLYHMSIPRCMIV